MGWTSRTTLQQEVTWTLKGQLLQRNGQDDEAIAALEKALEIEPRNPVAAQLLERLKGGGD